MRENSFPADSFYPQRTSAGMCSPGLEQVCSRLSLRSSDCTSSTRPGTIKTPLLRYKLARKEAECIQVQDNGEAEGQFSTPHPANTPRIWPGSTGEIVA